MSVTVYVDGACSKNPGPAGIAAIIEDGTGYSVSWVHIGRATNNIAELSAIELALTILEKRKEEEIIIYSDSSYAVGILMNLRWTARANAELVQHIREKIKGFKHLQLKWIPREKNIADAVAKKATKPT